MNKKPSHSQLFAALLLGQIIFGIASGAWCLQIIFATANSGDRATKCAAMVGRWVGICRNAGLVKALSIVAFEVVWILEIGMSHYLDCDSNKNPHLLACTVAIYVANRFAKQLREEDLRKSLSSPTNSEYA
jgi:hypothetical protein